MSYSLIGDNWGSKAEEEDLIRVLVMEDVMIGTGNTIIPILRMRPWSRAGVRIISSL